MSSRVETVIVQGTTVTVLARRNGWIKVALPGGTIGWVVAAGIGANGSTSASPSANASVNKPTAPARQGQAAQPTHTPTVKAKVNGLRVHSSPSLGAPVVTSVAQGQRMTVIARTNNWVKVRLSDGSVGWVSAAYATGKKAPAATTSTGTTASKIVPSTHVSTHGKKGTTSTVAMNVRSSPSLSGQVISVIMPGGSYRIIGWSGGWAHVRLPSGGTGWVSGTVIGTVPSTVKNSYSARHAKRTGTRSTAGTSVITAGVRVHLRPGIKAPVVTLAAAGTHVRVLGQSNGWTRVRLPNGITGYVLGTYVR